MIAIMEVEHSITHEKSGAFYSMRIEPPLTNEETASIPDPSFYGAKGREAVKPVVDNLADATNVHLPRWAFINHMVPDSEDSEFERYTQLVAETLGEASCNKNIEIT